jgi:hypothetical protein
MTGHTIVDEETKKIDSKKHKKYAQFLLYSYCHYILEIFNRLSDKPDINFSILLELVNNYILNLFTICLANQVSLDVSKGLIDEAVLIVLDYISISHEEEFAEQNYNPKFNDAIHFSMQKMQERILAVIPNKPIASVITNLPAAMSLSTSPRSLPNNTDGVTPRTSGTMKRRLPIPGSTSGFSNYISIMGCATNKTSRAIIFTADIITRIFNLFIQHSLELADRDMVQQQAYTHEHTPRWLDIFEPIVIDILADDIHEDDMQYSNSVFFTKLTYNLDILECFINMLLPQLLKLSQSLVSNLDMTRGQQIASDITQIYQRLSQHQLSQISDGPHIVYVPSTLNSKPTLSGLEFCGTAVQRHWNNNPVYTVPSFIYMAIIYNYLNTPELDTNILLNLNHCCQTGIFLGYASMHIPTSVPISAPANTVQTSLGKYHSILQQLKVALGHAKKINNKNLITALITLNSYLSDV